MNITSIEEFYGQSIGVKAPWKVVSVAIKAELKEIHVRLECEKGVLWANPRTEERIQIKDYQERTWRHLDTCEFKTMVSAAVPRVKYKGGGTEMVAVPWAEPGGRFTCRYESRLIEFLLEAGAVKAAARLARVTEDQMDGVMNRAVRRGLDRRKLPQISKIGLDEKAYRLGHIDSRESSGGPRRGHPIPSRGFQPPDHSNMNAPRRGAPISNLPSARGRGQ